MIDPRPLAQLAQGALRAEHELTRQQFHGWLVDLQREADALLAALEQEAARPEAEARSELPAAPLGPPVRLGPPRAGCPTCQGSGYTAHEFGALDVCDCRRSA